MGSGVLRELRWAKTGVKCYIQEIHYSPRKLGTPMLENNEQESLGVALNKKAK